MVTLVTARAVLKVLTSSTINTSFQSSMPSCCATISATTRCVLLVICFTASSVRCPNYLHKCVFHYCCQMTGLLLISSHSFIYFCHAPLWVCSTKCRHHSPEWMILSHVSCFIQGEVQWFQVLLGSLYPHSTGVPVVSSSSPRGNLLRSAWHLNGKVPLCPLAVFQSHLSR